MTIVSAQLFSYSLPLSRPLHLAGQMLSARSGLLLQVELSSGAAGWGEIAPLAGFSRETLAEATAQSLTLRQSLINSTLPDGLERLDDAFEQWLGRYELYPSVRCGIEMAILNALAQERRTTLAGLISAQCHNHVPVNALAGGRSDEILKRTSEAFRDGYKTIKFKTGELSAEQAAKVVKQIHVLTDRAFAVRVDPNRSWTLDKAIEFARELGGEPVEYVEEPLQDVKFLQEFANKSGLPIALDESLVGGSPNQLTLFEGLKALVLKPTLLGGFEKTATWTNFAEKNGLNAVISSSFESGVGMSALANLAAARVRESTACGFDTLGWFAKSITTEPLTITQGVTDIELWSERASRIDLSKLREII